MWISIVMIAVILVVVALIAAVVIVGQQGRYAYQVGDGISDHLRNTAKYLNGEKEYPELKVPRSSRR